VGDASSLDPFLEFQKHEIVVFKTLHSSFRLPAGHLASVIVFDNLDGRRKAEWIVKVEFNNTNLRLSRRRTNTPSLELAQILNQIHKIEFFELQKIVLSHLCI
jgi:hypothetical protein